MSKHQIYTMSFARIYPLLVAKAEKKERTKSEVDEIIRWLTGYTQAEIEEQLKKQVDYETFYKEAPLLNPSRDTNKRNYLRCQGRRDQRAHYAGNQISG